MKIKLLYIICLLTTQVTTPRAGDLDPTFGYNGTTPTYDGITITPFDGISTFNAGLLQPDGKIIGVGQRGNDFIVARYNSNGSPDTTFAGIGRTTTDFSGGVDIARAALLQPDGKIIALGQAGNNFALARYNPDGSLDTTFGGPLISPMTQPGTVVTNIINSIGGQINAALLQPDGKIVALGTTNISNFNFALARYNPDGSLDTSFGGPPISPMTQPGTVATNIINSTAERILAALLQPDGKIIALGQANVNGNKFALARYNPDGSLDTSFGGPAVGSMTQPGTVVTDIINSTSELILAALLQPDGKIIALGRADVNGTNFALARYNPDGSLDTSFGGPSVGSMTQPGTVATNIINSTDEQILAALLQPDGKIVALGQAMVNGTNFALARYNPDGSLDTSFGGPPIVPTTQPGTVVTDIINSTNELINAALLQPDGKIIGLGTSDNTTDLTIARYLNDALTITKTASAPIACPGQNITYTICANNFGGGGGTVNGIEITDILPDNIIFRSATANMGTFDPITGTWSIDYLQANNKATLKIKARVNQCAGNTLIKNTALTSYSSVDMVSDSSIIDVINQDFSTTECISTLPVVYENLNHIVQRTDCGVDNMTDDLGVFSHAIRTIKQQQATTRYHLQTILNKLDCLATYLSATDCTF